MYYSYKEDESLHLIWPGSGFSALAALPTWYCRRYPIYSTEMPSAQHFFRFRTGAGFCRIAYFAFRRPWIHQQSVNKCIRDFSQCL